MSKTNSPEHRCTDTNTNMCKYTTYLVWEAAKALRSVTTWKNPSVDFPKIMKIIEPYYAWLCHGLPWSACCWTYKWTDRWNGWTDTDLPKRGSTDSPVIGGAESSWDFGWRDFWSVTRILVGWGEFWLGGENFGWMGRILVGWGEFLLGGENFGWMGRILVGWGE